jgi:hypothetical protein
MIDILRGRLAELAALGQTITYGDLARELAIPAPSIATLTAMLESLMAQDAAAGRPFIAAMMEGKLGDGMPSLGFFEKAVELDAVLTGDPASFVLEQRAQLHKLYDISNQ